MGQKNINTAYGKQQAVTVDVYKDPVSEQAAEAAKVIVPELAAAIVKALIAHGAVSALGEAASGWGEASETVKPVVEEALE